MSEIDNSISVVILDDDLHFAFNIAEHLGSFGIEARAFDTPRKVMDYSTNNYDRTISLLVTDMMFHEPDSVRVEQKNEIRNYVYPGIRLVKQLRKQRENLRVLGFSVDHHVDKAKRWFERYGDGFMYKSDNPRRIAERAVRLVAPDRAPDPRVFIVHGHDHSVLQELRNYVRDDLGIGAPTILRDEAGLGRTIHEMFCDEADPIDVACVLLTPDDQLAEPGSEEGVLYRARQNVIFELGYFLGLFRHGSGVVLLFHRGPLDLPSDIHGVRYIDITNGIRAADAVIRQQLPRWLQDVVK